MDLKTRDFRGFVSLCIPRWQGYTAIETRLFLTQTRYLASLK